MDTSLSRDAILKFFPGEMTRADLERAGDQLLELPETFRDGDQTRADMLQSVDFALDVLEITGAKTIDEAMEAIRRLQSRHAAN